MKPPFLMPIFVGNASLYKSSHVYAVSTQQ